MHMRQIHDNLPLEVVENVIMSFSIQLLVDENLYLFSPQFMTMADCFFEGRSQLHPTDISDARNKHWIDDYLCFYPCNY
jgi:hypothetical protein